MSTNAEVVEKWDKQEYGSWNNAIDALIKALDENAREVLENDFFHCEWRECKNHRKNIEKKLIGTSGRDEKPKVQSHD